MPRRMYARAPGDAYPAALAWCIAGVFCGFAAAVVYGSMANACSAVYVCGFSAKRPSARGRCSGKGCGRCPPRAQP